LPPSHIHHASVLSHPARCTLCGAGGPVGRCACRLLSFSIAASFFVSSSSLPSLNSTPFPLFLCSSLLLPTLSFNLPSNQPNKQWLLDSWTWLWMMSQSPALPTTEAPLAVAEDAEDVAADGIAPTAAPTAAPPTVYVQKWQTPCPKTQIEITLV